jgi:hypothetical protein
MPQEPLKSMKKIEKDTVFVTNKDDSKLKKYQDSLNLYNKNKKAYESGIETKPKGLKYENAIKRNTYGDRFYLKEGTPVDIVKKPTQPVKYKQANEKPKLEVKGSKKYFINETQVDEKTFNKIAPIKLMKKNEE